MANQHFDVVVVGSGFGGSVTTCRLAEAGMKVCLLERGKAYPPGTFPRSPAGMRTNFWDPSEGLHGLYSTWAFKGINALVSAGLGGGSLIYANVLLRKDRNWFEEEYDGKRWAWPVDRDTLDPYYDRVEQVMKPQRFPFDHDPYKTTWKTRKMKELSERLQMTFDTPPLAVTFGNHPDHPIPGQKIDEEQRNLHDRDRYTCLLVGECDVGCNFGSKNTLDYTYLSIALHAGAEIRVRSEVKSLRPRAQGGYEIEYLDHREAEEGRKADTKRMPRVTITADRLILSAGALGTPYLLLKNRSHFPRFNQHLGTKFCGNGDLLGFLLRCSDPKLNLRENVNPSHAPVITSALRAPDALDDPEARRRGFYIEDGGHPEFINWLIEASQVPGMVRRTIEFAWLRVRSMITRDPRSELSREMSALFGKCDFASSSFPVLGMGRDVADGKMTLNGDFLAVDWNIESSKEYFDGLRGKMQALAKLLHADFRDNPIWYFKRVITVHPLGGCPMGHDEGDGFVDSFGRVYGYDGLYVADGSVMPGPVGANPAMTIAAVAERTAEHIVQSWRRTS